MPIPPPATGRRLVVNGYSLAIPGQGIGVYSIRLLQGLLRALPRDTLRVVIPAPLAKHANWLPGEVVDVIPGSTPRGANQLLTDVYWASKTGAYVKSHYNDPIFFCPREYYAWTSPVDTVMTIHDCNHWLFPASRGSAARAWWRRATERFAARRSPFVLTVSNWAKRDLVRIAKIPERKVHVVYNWVDPTVTRAGALEALPGVRSRLQLPEQYFLYVGGFSANKNIDALLRAYAQASQRVSLPPLVAAGDLGQYRHGFGRDFHDALRDIGFPPGKIITPGFVAAADLPPLMAGASLLIYPSKSEGFGYPPVEALALETPVVVADATSMPEVVPNPACRFAPENESELAEKLAHAASSPSTFRCELREQFTEAYGVRHYLRIMSSLGVAAQAERARAVTA